MGTGGEISASCTAWAGQAQDRGPPRIHRQPTRKRDLRQTPINKDELFSLGPTALAKESQWASKYSRGFSVATRERPVLPTPSSASHSSSHLLLLPLRKCRLRHLILGVESSIEGQPQ